MLEFYLLLTLGAFIGGFVNGLAGFGTGLFALSFFLSIMSPIEAVAVIVIMSVFAGALGMVTIRDSIAPNKHAIYRFMIPGLVGVPIGVWALSFVNSEVLRLLVAILLLLYGSYFLMQSNVARLKGSFPIFDMIIGYSGGLLGGLASLSGALPTMWLAMRAFDKQTTRAILQSYNLALLTLTTILLMANGVYSGQSLVNAMIAIVVALLAARLGLLVFQRLSTSQFQKLLIIITFLSGAVMLMLIGTE